MNLACSSATYTIPASDGVDVSIGGTFKLISITMRLQNTAANTFNATLTRGGIEFELFSHVGNYQDVTWLLNGGGIVLVSGDVIRFANTAAEVGYVFFGYEMAGPLGPIITVTPGPVADDAAGPAA